MVYLGLLAAILAVVVGLVFEKKAPGMFWLAGVGALVTGVLIVVLPVVTWQNGAKVYRLQAFFESNAGNYQVAVDETASYLSEEEFVNQLVAGSIEKLEQSTYVSERIKEWRDSVNAYNLTVAGLKYWDDNPFTGVLVPDSIQDMKLLLMSSSE